MRRWKALILLLTLLVAAGVGGWLARRPIHFPAPKSIQGPAISLQSGSIVLRHKGEKVAEIGASSVKVSRDLRFATLRGIGYAVFYRERQVALRVNADEIILDRQTGDVAARGHLEMTSPQGWRLWSTEARWVQADSRLVLSRGVRLRVGRNEVRALRLFVNTAAQTLEMEGGVDVTFDLKEARR